MNDLQSSINNKLQNNEDLTDFETFALACVAIKIAFEIAKIIEYNLKEKK